jgi:hypothetical protein
MPEVNYEWVKTQLAAAKVPKPVGNAVMSLMSAWEPLKFPATEHEQKTLEVFSKLAQGHAIHVSEGRWVPANVGAMIQVGDIVRVRTDAFNTPTGKTHNGRQGKVVAKRSGDIIVDLTDDLGPKLESVHYPASKLEKRVD